MDAGIHTIPANQYHQDPADGASLSNSLIKVLLNQSPAHARLKHPKLNPDLEQSEESKFDIGKAAHAALLEGIDNVRVIEADDWRTKDAKQQRDEARASGKIPLLRRHFTELSIMVETARRFIATNPILSKAFASGQPEQTMLWKEGNVWCRAMIDWLADDRRTIVDYKTTSASCPDDFIRSSMTAFGYDTQEAFYKRGMASLRHQADFFFLVQEDSAPFACYIVQCAESMREMAAHKVERAIALWEACLIADQWPSYPEGVYVAEAQAWALTKELSHD